MSGKLSSIISKKIKTVVSIEYISFKILLESYQLSLLRKEYKLDWDEEQFSQYLADLMKENLLRVKYQLTIGVERKLNDNTKLPIGSNHPKKLPRIDINIVSWSFKKDTEQEYFFEAKNLCENNWQKESKATVIATAYQRRYIKTGIENFRKGRYYNGAIIGYVLEGCVSAIIKKLNIRLAKDTNTIQDMQSCKNIYNSIHLTPKSKNIEIKHLLLKF